MVGRRVNAKQRIFDRVGYALQRPVEIRWRGVDKQIMIETFGNEPPASNQWITQDQGGIIPNETIAHRRGVTRDHNNDNQSDGEHPFHKAMETPRNRKNARLNVKMAGATIRWSILVGLFLLVSNARAGGVPADCTQLIVA